MKVVAENRRAKFDYEITDTVEAGIVLTGPEAKSCRLGQVNLAGSYVSMLSGKPVLKGTKISKYPFSADQTVDPERDRSLLLKKSEIARLDSTTTEKGMTVVPLKVLAGKYVKVVLGIGRGRKRFDKRQRMREREVGRKLRRGQEI